MESYLERQSNSDSTCALWSTTLFNKFQMICTSKTYGIELKAEQLFVFFLWQIKRYISRTEKVVKSENEQT